MSAPSVYLDSSALIKLVFEEPETAALGSFLRDRPVRASSVVARVEVMRTARTARDADVTRHAESVLTGITLISVRPDLIGAAVGVEPLSLRSLDAIHLATALSLQPELAGMIVYDRRLADAARAAGLTVWAPA